MLLKRIRQLTGQVVTDGSRLNIGLQFNPANRTSVPLLVTARVSAPECRIFH